MNPKLFWLLTAFLLVSLIEPRRSSREKSHVSATSPLLVDIKNPGRVVEAFQQGFRDLGYIEGKNIIVEYRYPGAEPERFRALVTELIRLKVDALVTSSTPAIRAAKEATRRFQSL